MNTKAFPLNTMKIVLLIFLTLTTYLYSGFFFPDPHFYDGPASGGHKLLLLGIRIAFPVIVLTIATIILLYKKGKIAGTSLFLLTAGGMLGLLFCYPVFNILFFESRPAIQKEGFHSFLQLTPPDINVPDKDEEKKLRVFALGGSTTAWKASNGVGWTDILQKKLVDSCSGAGCEGVTVYNVGKEWYTTAHTLLNYQLNVRQHKPDMIIVMHAINDLLINADFSYFSGGTFRPDYGHFYGPLSRLVKNGHGLFSMLSEKISQAWYHTPRSVIETEKFPGISSFERNLQSLIDLAAVDNVRVVLITQPHILKDQMTADEVGKLYMLNHEAVGPESRWGLKTVLAGMRQYNERVREIARRNKNVDLIDLEVTLPKSLEYFTDEVHYTDKAHPFIGETIANELASVILKS